MENPKNTKARIKEIRNRVFNEPLEKILVDDTKDVVFEKDLHVLKLEPLALKAENLVVKELQSDFINKEDFISFKNQLNDNIEGYFEALDLKITTSLNSFGAKIPDIKKGSAIREELDNEIGDIISQKMIQQSRSLNRTVEDLRGSFTSKRDLSELKTALEGVLADGLLSSSNTAEELRKDLRAGLAENSNDLAESNSSNKKEFSSFIDNLTAAKHEINQSNDKIALLSSSTQHLMSEAALDLERKNDAFEMSFTKKLESRFEDNQNKINELQGVLADGILNSANAKEELRKGLETGLVENFDKLEGFYSSIREDFNFEKDEINIKIQQNAHKITVVSSDIRNKIAKISLDLLSKNNFLQETLLQKISAGREANTKEINDLESLLTNSIVRSANSSETLKKELAAALVDNLTTVEEVNISIQKDFSAFIEGYVFDKNQININLKQNNDKMNLLSSDTKNLVYEVKSDLEKKSSAIENSLTQKLEVGFQKNSDKFSELESSVSDQILTSPDTSDAIKKDVERTLVEKLSKLEYSSSSIQEELNSFVGGFTVAKHEIHTQIKQSDDKINLLSSDTQSLISKITLDLEARNKAMELSLVELLKDSYDKSMNKLEQLDRVVSDSILKSANVSEVVKKDLELGLVESFEKFEEFYGSIRKDFTFANDAIDTKIQQNDDKINALSFDVRNKIAKTTLDFEMKNSILKDKLSERSKGVFSRLNTLEAEIKTDLKELQSAIKKKLK